MTKPVYLPEVFLMEPGAPDQKSVGTEKTTILYNTPGRVGLVLQNVHDTNIVSLSFGDNNPTLYKGVTLYPHEMFMMNDCAFSTGKVKAIASGEDTPIAIQEFTQVD